MPQQLIKGYTMLNTKLSQINTLETLARVNLKDLADQIDLLAEDDFEVMEGAYYAYSAMAVATLFVDVDGEELEYRLVYPISGGCYIDDDGEAADDGEGELDESMACSEALERLHLDICDGNDIELELYK